LAVEIFSVVAWGQSTNRGASAPPPQKAQPPLAARVFELKASDGTVLKASYFAAPKPGPGVWLFPSEQPDT
jgi:hypothetical protein